MSTTRVYHVTLRQPLPRPTCGKLFCQACGVEPLKVYGVEVIEAHHRIPLSKSEEGRVTEISDLIMLCPSCHRAVHRIPDCDVEALKLKLNV